MHALEKEMATLSSILTWRIPGTEEPGGLLSTGLIWVGHNWSNLAAAAVDIIVNLRGNQNIYNQNYKKKVLLDVCQTINTCTTKLSWFFC